MDKTKIEIVNLADLLISQSGLDSMNLLNAGCGTHYAEGWVNTDVWENDETKPDIRVTPGEPYPFPDNYFDAVFMGHVIEHIEWPSLPAFIFEMSRIAKPDAPMLLVGPDVYRTLHLWREGKQPWWLVESVMEHQDMAPLNHDGTEWWGNAAHHWNCHERRVIELLQKLGFTEIESVSDLIPSGNDWADPKMRGLVWPVVGKADWQFGLRVINRLA